mgnify:FL=1
MSCHSKSIPGGCKGYHGAQLRHAVSEVLHSDESCRVLQLSEAARDKIDAAELFAQAYSVGYEFENILLRHA